MDYEQEVMELIAAAGDNKDKSFAALEELKNGNIESAKNLIKEAKKTDVAAHNVQTQLISKEMDPEQESVPMTLLMAHAQDHYMTSQLARDLIERFIDIFEQQGSSVNLSKKENTNKENNEEERVSSENKPKESVEVQAAQLSKAKAIAKNSQDDKMKILLCCEGGLSTNLLMQNMKKVVKNSNKLTNENFDFTAIPVDALEREIQN